MLMNHNLDNENEQDIKKINAEIEEELLQYLETGDSLHDREEQEIGKSSFQTIFQSIMTIVLVVIVIINIALIIYKLLT